MTLRGDKSPDTTSTFLGRTCRCVQAHRTGPRVSRVSKLRPGHSGATVTSIAFALFQDIQWARNADNIGAARRKSRNTFLQNLCIPYHKVQNDLEVAGRDPLQCGLQVKVMEPECLIQFFIRSHVTSSRHFNKCIQRYVKDGSFRTVLKCLGQAAFSGTRRSVQYDGGGFHCACPDVSKCHAGVDR